MTIVFGDGLSLLISLLAQTSLVLIFGLLAARFFKSRGPAYAVLIYRATLVAAATVSLVAVLGAGHIKPVVSVSATPAPIHIASAPPSLHPETTAVTKPALTTTYTKPTAAATQRESSVSFVSASAIAWAIGACALLCTLLFGHMSLVRMRRRSHPVTSGGLFDLLRCLASERKLQPPSLVLDGQGKTPFLAGIRQPTIYVPADLATGANTDSVKAVLAHELCHLAQKDCLWRLIERVACSLFWAQPLMWLVCRKLDQASEELCDQIVLQEGVAPEQYANCLWNLAMVQVQRPMQVTVSAGVVDFRSSIGKRIAAILDRSRRFSTVLSGRVRFAGLVAALCVPVLAVMLVSKGVTAGQGDDPIFTFTKDSDRRAVDSVMAMLRNYRSMETFSSRVAYDDGNQQLAWIDYKQPGGPITVAGTRSMLPVKKIYAEESQVTVVNVGQTGYQLARRPANDEVPSSWPTEFSGLQAVSNIGQVKVMMLAALLEKISIPANLLKLVKPAVARYLGVSKVHGVDVDEVELMRNGEVTTKLLIGQADHLLYRETSLQPDGKQIEQESYDQMKVNARIDDAALTFVPPAGSTLHMIQTDLTRPNTVDAKAQPLVDQMKAAYNAMNSLSYEDRAELREQFYQGAKLEKITQHVELTVALQRSGNYSMDLHLDDYPQQCQRVIVNNGKSFATSTGTPDKYLVGDATGADISFGGLGIPGGYIGGLDVADAFYHGQSGRMFNHTTLGAAGPVISGEPTETLVDTLDTHIENAPDETYREVKTFYLGKNSHLVLRIVKQSTNSNHGRATTGTTTEEFERMKVNEPIDPETFRFVPAPGSTPVTSERDMRPEYEKVVLPKLGEIFPDFSSVDIAGKPIKLSDYRGKVVFLHAWTFGVANYEWDLPHFEKLANRLRSQGVEVIGIVGEDSTMRKRVEKYLADNNIHTRQVFDGEGEAGGVLKDLKVRMYPYDYVIGRNGEVVAVNLMNEDVDRAVEAALKMR